MIRPVLYNFEHKTTVSECELIVAISFFSCFYVLLTVCVVVFYQWHFFSFYSAVYCIAASLFNKLTYLPIYYASLTIEQLSTDHNQTIMVHCCQ